MVVTKTRRRTEWGNLVVFSQASGVNLLQTCGTDSLQPYQVLFVTVQYSASPTHSGATFRLNSFLGGSFLTLLKTGAANAQSTVFEPTTDLVLHSDDALIAGALAGGVGITSSIAIYCLTGKD